MANTANIVQNGIANPFYLVDVNGNPNVVASSTSSLTSIGASTSSVILLAANVLRKGMAIYNDSSSAMYLAFAATASTTAYTVKIPANNFFEMPTTPVYVGAISAVWDTATGNARVTELS